MAVPITGMYSFVNECNCVGVGRMMEEKIEFWISIKHFHSFAPSMIIESEIYRWEKRIILAKRRNNKIFPPTTSRSREGIEKGRFSFICWWRLLALLLNKFIVLLRFGWSLTDSQGHIEEDPSQKLLRNLKCEPHLIFGRWYIKILWIINCRKS